MTIPSRNNVGQTEYEQYPFTVQVDNKGSGIANANGSTAGGANNGGLGNVAVSPKGELITKSSGDVLSDIIEKRLYKCTRAVYPDQTLWEVPDPDTPDSVLCGPPGSIGEQFEINLETKVGGPDIPNWGLEVYYFKVGSLPTSAKSFRCGIIARGKFITRIRDGSNASESPAYLMLSETDKYPDDFTRLPPISSEYDILNNRPVTVSNIDGLTPSIKYEQNRTYFIAVVCSILSEITEGNYIQPLTPLQRACHRPILYVEIS